MFDMKKVMWILSGLLVAGLIWFFVSRVPFRAHNMLPAVETVQEVALDSESPWPRFRANSLQNGRAPVQPQQNPRLRPWSFMTGKGIFSSPVIDAAGNIYIGSADHNFYSIASNGSLNWTFPTGEIIDSSALLDDRQRVYFGSGDAHVYCLDRRSGELVWKTAAHSVEQVEAEFDLETYNLNWFEGNIGMLPGGNLLAPNDNYLVYEIERDTGERVHQYIANEMVWSLPAVNTETGALFFGSQFMALKNLFSYNFNTKARRWTAGGLGSNAASPLLTSNAADGGVIVGGYDGYVRAYSQLNGKQLWKRGLRDHIYSSPAQLSDGTIIQPSADGTVYALNPRDGKVEWAFDTLEPIRSSPAVAADDTIYVGSGEGRLYCINADGTLRWSYLCIDEVRNDLNSSPALGPQGVCIAGENGGIFFVPYDYPLTPAGLRDPRCDRGPGEKLPEEGSYLVFTGRFGGLPVDPPQRIEANQPLAFTLVVRENGDTLKSAIDPKTLEVEVSGEPDFKLEVAAHRQFVLLTPSEYWVSDLSSAGGKATREITVKLSGSYKTDLRRIGLKFFGGRRTGTFEHEFQFEVSIGQGDASQFPYQVPERSGDASTVFELSRLAAPNPTMLPSWNQIGFDSLHYLAGTVGWIQPFSAGRGSGSAGNGADAVDSSAREVLVWVIGGKLQDGTTGVDPSLQVRYPLHLRMEHGLVTLSNYEGFKINFIGSWDMPFKYYRISAAADQESGEILSRPALTAVALGDEIEFYGRFLKLMGMTDFRTGEMPVFGGLDLQLFGTSTPPHGVMPETVGFSVDGSRVRADLSSANLSADAHVLSLVLTDPESGRALPLYYSNDTTVTSDERGKITEVAIDVPDEFVPGGYEAVLMVDTSPAARQDVRLTK